MDAVFSSGPPWSGHLVALTLAREFGLPWVAEFRDQWVADPFDVPPTPPSVVMRDARAEARVMRQADLVVCVVDSLRDLLRTRYPKRSPGGIVTIMNGFDPAILEGVSSEPPSNEANQLRFVHTGHFYGKRRIEPFLEAITTWLANEPGFDSQLRVKLLGGLADYFAELQARIAALGNPAFVQIAPETSHRDAVNQQAQATVLLLVGFAGPGAETQMSGKIFEYLAARRPIMALAPPASPVGDVLRASGVKHWIVSPDDHAGLVRALTEIGNEWRAGKLAGPQGSASLSAFDRREQTKTLASVLELAISNHRSGR